MMPATASHAIFVFSFVSAFSVCYVGSQYLSSVLRNADFDLFRAILGHEKRPENMSSQLVKDFSTNQLAQLVAIALTAVTSLAIFWKFSQSVFNPACACAKRTETDVYLQRRRSRCWTPRIGKNSRS